MQYPFPCWFERNLNAVINGINRVHVNVWGVVIVGVGAWLMIRGQAASGTALLTGGFAIINRASETTPGKTTSVSAKGGEATATSEQAAVE